MNTPLGRNGLIGLAVGATAGLGLIAIIIYREIRRRESQRMALEARPAPQLFDAEDRAALLLDTHDAQGRFLPGTDIRLPTHTHRMCVRKRLHSHCCADCTLLMLMMVFINTI